MDWSELGRNAGSWVRNLSKFANKERTVASSAKKVVEEVLPTVEESTSRWDRVLSFAKGRRGRAVAGGITGYFLSGDKDSKDQKFENAAIGSLVGGFSSNIIKTLPKSFSNFSETAAEVGSLKAAYRLRAPMTVGGGVLGAIYNKRNHKSAAEGFLVGSGIGMGLGMSINLYPGARRLLTTAKLDEAGKAIRDAEGHIVKSPWKKGLRTSTLIGGITVGAAATIIKRSNSISQSEYEHKEEYDSPMDEMEHGARELWQTGSHVTNKLQALNSGGHMALYGSR